MKRFLKTCFPFRFHAYLFARPFSLLLFVLYIFSVFFPYAVVKVHRSHQETVRSLGAGGDNEIRTRDLLLARQALSQLSYAPVGSRDRALKIEQ